MSEMVAWKDDLPNGWIEHNLEDCVEILDSKRIPINANERKQRQGNVPYFGSTGQVGWIDDYLFNEELVLLGEDAAPFLDIFRNKAYLISGKSWVNNHAHVLKTINNLLSNRFLCYFLNQFDYHEYVTGTTRLKLNQKSMRMISILLPPLNEQKRIVIKIESIFAQIDASKESLKKVQALIKQTIQVVLKQAFEGKLVQQDPNNELQSISYEEISHENTAKYSNRIKKINLPSRWTFCLFEDIVDFKNGINFTKNEKGIKGIPTIDVLNMYSESPYVSLDKVYKVNKKTNSDYVLKNGDLLFVRSSVKREGVGYTTLFKEVGKDITYCGFIIRARLLFKDILPMYLLYYFRYNKTRNEIIKSASQVTITNINQKTLGKIQIVLPPISEQRRIVTKIESIFGNIDTLNLFCFILRGNLFTNIGYFMILYMQHVISEQ